MSKLSVFRVRNTCSKCGRSITEAYAPHRDAARSGHGLCQECAKPGEAIEVVGGEADSRGPGVNITRQARQFAQEHGIALADLPSGKRIGIADLRRYLREQKSGGSNDED